MSIVFAATASMGRRLVEALPNHFFLENDKVYVRFDELRLRRDPVHKGQLLMEVCHEGEALVTQMMPDPLDSGGTLNIVGMIGHTGLSFVQD